MSLDYKTLKEIQQTIQGDITTELPESDASLLNSWLRALVVSVGNRYLDSQNLIKQLEKEVFLATMSDDRLEARGAEENVDRIQALFSAGSMCLQATVTSVAIPINTQFRSENSDLFETIIASTTITNNLSISSLTRSGSIVTATTSSVHNLASNIDVTIVGSVETEYNGSQTITVLSTTTFTYSITTTPTSPATGTITGSWIGSILSIQSLEAGADQNLIAGATLTITSPIVDVETNGYATIDAVVGGSDEEVDDIYRARIYQARSNPVANFNETAIIKIITKISGIDRIKIKPITPEAGDVTILFLDGDGIPSGAKVTEVKNKVLEIAPVTTNSANIYVTAPTPVSTDYTFTAIDPDTPQMRTAITDNLTAFYQDQVDFETDIQEDNYRNAIINTIDPFTDNKLLTFTLSTPSGDITVTTDEIGILGSVTFAI